MSKGGHGTSKTQTQLANPGRWSLSQYPNWNPADATTINAAGLPVNTFPQTENDTPGRGLGNGIDKFGNGIDRPIIDPIGPPNGAWVDRFPGPSPGRNYGDHDRRGDYRDHRGWDRHQSRHRGWGGRDGGDTGPGGGGGDIPPGLPTGTVNDVLPAEDPIAIAAYNQMMGGNMYGGVIPDSAYSLQYPGDVWGTLNSMGITQNPMANNTSQQATGMTNASSFGSNPWQQGQATSQAQAQPQPWSNRPWANTMFGSNRGVRGQTR